MRLTRFLLRMPLAVLGHPLIVEHSTISSNPIQVHNDPLRGLQLQDDVIIQVFTPVKHSIQKRDSVTIHIESAFHHTSVENTQNNAKFQVVNNAKNANIAVGDHSSHSQDFDSFGDKNMLNSTGSNTGGWNTKNNDSTITTGRYGKLMVRRDKKNRSNKSLTRRIVEPLEARDIVNLDIKGGTVKNSNVTRSGNGNTVEVYIAGTGQNVVNVTLSWEAEDSKVEDSNNENVIKVFIGDAQEVELGNSTVFIETEP